MEREIGFELVERIYFGPGWVDELLAHRSQFALKLTTVANVRFSVPETFAHRDLRNPARTQQPR